MSRELITNIFIYMYLNMQNRQDYKYLRLAVRRFCNIISTTLFNYRSRKLGLWMWQRQLPWCLR